MLDLLEEQATFLAGVAGMATSQVLSNKFKDEAIGMIKLSEIYAFVRERDTESLREEFNKTSLKFA